MITKFTEMNDAQVDEATLDELREAYRALRTHHVAETSALWNKVENLRKLATRRSK